MLFYSAHNTVCGDGEDSGGFWGAARETIFPKSRHVGTCPAAACVLFPLTPGKPGTVMHFISCNNINSIQDFSPSASKGALNGPPKASVKFDRVRQSPGPPWLAVQNAGRPTVLFLFIYFVHSGESDTRWFVHPGCDPHGTTAAYDVTVSDMSGLDLTVMAPWILTESLSTLTLMCTWKIHNYKNKKKE